jgi:bacteriorhodopsin
VDCMETIRSLYTVSAVAYALVFGVGLLLFIANTKNSKSEAWILLFGLVVASWGGYHLLLCLQGLAAPILVPEYAECVNAPKE